MLYIIHFFILDVTDASPKPLSCFDVSCDGRFIVAGTDVLKDDAFLLFWDIRTTNLLGGYWDTHQDDITQVKILCYTFLTSVVVVAIYLSDMNYKNKIKFIFEIP